ncbi:PEP-CTERM sorting domain-containing protein [Rugamonas sp. CCM 8940]|uniref:PEP-CTERM sorting domain-containing protein n=1 Tax=Rugamonas sp. CCM 8940 TaxID=2765359 RepID=UPI0018F3AB86|nr:PEP-CTERM sorting domain-containing protein [Rugamonas sp. CCM 8940]MBJ7309524.1 PEP-CTERM sorting domain-containing protein [Rugamonas sp. CCM 8940]
MKISTPLRLLGVLLGATLALSSAQARNMVQLDGATASFFYDSDFWGVGGVTVQGNSLSFPSITDFSSAASVTFSTGNARDFYSTGTEVWAVAKAGSSLKAAVTIAATTHVTLGPKGADARAGAGLLVYGGNWNGSNVGSDSFLGYVPPGTHLWSNGTAQDITRAHSYTSADSTTPFQALNLHLSPSVWANQVDFGYASASISSLRLDLTTVAAVPEPESYAMLLAGLGMLAGVARRRQAAQQA